MATEAIGSGSTVAGRFTLEVLLSEGRGARTWRATDQVLKRGVAIRALRHDDERAPVVLQAARQSAHLNDARPLRVLDAFEEGDFVYVVLEWGQGLTLDQLCAGGDLEPRRAAWLLREVAEFLTVAHARELSHGRLLPEHVVLTSGGAVRVIDFSVEAALAGNAIGAEGIAADLASLRGLLYASLVGSWPGTPTDSLPRAPRVAERTLQPRQVRAGVSQRLNDLWVSLEANPEIPARQIFSALDAYLHKVDHDITAAESFDALALVANQGPGSALAPSPSTPETLDPDATHWSLPEVTEGRSPASNRAPLDLPAVEGFSAPFEPGRVGLVPDSWGPDPEIASVDEEIPPDDRPGPLARWGIGALFVAVLLFALIAATDLQGRDFVPQLGGISQPAPPENVLAEEELGEVAIVAISDFDPEQTDGTPEENPELVPLAVDGDPQTAWRTLRYVGGPPLAPYKQGVGLLIDLGRPVPIRQVEVSLVGSQYDVDLYLGGQEPPSLSTGIEGLTEIGAVTGVGDVVTLTPSAEVVGQHLVLWLTALPAAPSGGYQGQVAEVVVRS